MTLIFRNKLSAECSIVFKYHLDDSIFNIRQLHAPSSIKVSTVTVHKVQCADDAGLLSHTPLGLHHSLNALTDTYHSDHQYKEYGDSVIRFLWRNNEVPFFEELK